MKRTAIFHLFALLTVVVVADGHLVAQRDQPDTATLRTRIDQRFEVLQIRDGVVLKPRDSSKGVQSIEVTNDLVAIDGQPVTGPELRQKLGTADADLVREFSYLTREQQRDLFTSTREPNLPAVVPSLPPPAPDAPPPPLSRAERRSRGRGRDGDR